MVPNIRFTYYNRYSYSVADRKNQKDALHVSKQEL